MAAVAQDADALEYASAELRADREVVLAAVAQKGLAVKYASDELRSRRRPIHSRPREASWWRASGHRAHLPDDS